MNDMYREAIATKANVSPELITPISPSEYDENMED